jgi:hypothetical protein
MEYKNELEDRAGGLSTANLYWKKSLNVVFLPCQLRTSVAVLFVFRDFVSQNLLITMAHMYLSLL